MTADRPALADIVPGFFASEAYTVLGPRAIEAGDTESALRIGREAISAAPIEPNSTALLGSAQMAAEQFKEAERTFRVAGKLGWRVPSTQAYWQMRALAVNDYTTAALRTDALLRQDPTLLGQRRLLDSLERNSYGREALVGRMRLRPRWVAYYGNSISGVPTDSLLQRAEVLNLAAQRGLQLGCEDIGPITNRLVELNFVAVAEQLWRGHCPLPRSGLLFDGSMTSLQLDQPPSPFVWSLIGQSDVSVGITPASDGKGQQVHFESTASFPRRALTQLVAVPPGRYRLSWAAGRSDDQPATGLRAAITCHIDINPWTAGTYDPATKRWHADFQVANDCPGHWINFGLMPGSGSLWIEHTSLQRLDSPAAK